MDPNVPKGMRIGGSKQYRVKMIEDIRTSSADLKQSKYLGIALLPTELQHQHVHTKAITFHPSGHLLAPDHWTIPGISLF